MPIIRPNDSTGAFSANGNGKPHNGKPRQSLAELLRANVSANGQELKPLRDKPRDWGEEEGCWEGGDGHIPAWIKLSPEEQDRRGFEAAKMVAEDMTTPRPKIRSEPDPVPDPELMAKLANFDRLLYWATAPQGILAKDPNLIDAILSDCRAMGLVGVRNNILAIYLIGTSRLLDRPLAAIVQGSSSTGKSYVVSQVTKLFPPDKVLNATRMSPKSLYYGEPLSHKFVVGGERSRNTDDGAADVTAALRQLLSEGRISNYVPEKKDGKHSTRLVQVEGPIAYVETTTLDPQKIFREDLNRALLLKTDESEQQTRAILDQAANRAAGKDTSLNHDEIIGKHHAFQSMLESRSVVIPYAAALLGRIPEKKVEARRVAKQVLSMIEAVTLLHQFQREQDAHGRLIATDADYQVARSILVQPLGESLGVAASPAKLYQKLSKRFPEGQSFTTADAQKLDSQAHENSVKNWLRSLADHGCIQQVEAARGPKPAKWKLRKSPGEAILPERV